MVTSNVYHVRILLTSFVLLLCLGLFAPGKSSKMNLQKQMQELDINHLPDGNYAVTLIYPQSISTSIIVKAGNKKRVDISEIYTTR